MSEKRQAERIDSLNLSYVLLDEEGKSIHQGMGRTLNVSEKGIFLETSFPIDRSHTVVLTIGLANETIDIKAKATHLRQLENGRFGTGLAFSEMPKRALDILKEFFQTIFEENIDFTQGTAGEDQ
jgi:hypothetical protein